MDTEQTIQRMHVLENHVRTLGNMADVPDGVAKPFKAWLSDEFAAIARDIKEDDGKD